MRYLELKVSLRSIKDLRRIGSMLDPYLRDKLLTGINGDLIWSISQRKLAKCNKLATVNPYLATIRGILRMAGDEWQWVQPLTTTASLSIGLRVFPQLQRPSTTSRSRYG